MTTATTSVQSAKSADRLVGCGGTISAMLEAIRTHWGLPDFMPLQDEALESALRGRDLLAVLPTGGGKSLCYQAPALYAAGLTLVISPLIALMRDQVDALRRRNIDAAYLNSQQHPREQAAIEDRIKGANQPKLLYVAPERCHSPAFLALLSQIYYAGRLHAIVIDEAHCIAQWGHDFRPDYTLLGGLRHLFPRVPIQAYTATATPRTRTEIIDSLGMVDPDVIVADIDRPNLTLRVEPRTAIDQQLLDLLSPLDKGGQRGVDAYPCLIYAPTRIETQRIAAMLRRHGNVAYAYHAGLPDDQRSSVQDRFMRGVDDVVVATIAFGMGVDKPDVRQVIHTMMPSSVEEYHQQIGRAGRDGQPAECTLLYHPDDYERWLDLLDIDLPATAETVLRSYPDDTAWDLPTIRYYRLAGMRGYCDDLTHGSKCRHAYLTEYFGQPYARDNCEACDVCMGATGGLSASSRDEGTEGRRDEGSGGPSL